MAVTGMDHVAIPAGDPEALLRFYRALGFEIVHEEEWRSGDFPIFAIACGDQKINVHDPKLWQNPRFELRGPTAEPGCGDFCFVWEGTPESASAAIEAAGAEVIEGPASRVGGRAAGTTEGVSVYTRDPDGNLVELISYDS
ncbi:MAG: VOC family protein [Chloroflexi bacterium]|nr:VOC family protein [Chloroflexota bacterium]MCY3697021.1 VOC family protein [Chloroflexota bacterium]